MHIKKNDTVIVLCGKDKGKTGKVLKLFPDRERAIVEGINIVKKHMRKRSEQDPGGITQVPAPMRTTKLGVYCSSCKKAVRFSIKILEDKSKIRVCKKCQATL